MIALLYFLLSTFWELGTVSYFYTNKFIYSSQQLREEFVMGITIS